jgi:two-component system, chemotaxis family, sensor kinase Cph1
MSAPAPVDLSTCDREPIHIPGAIQPHGVLLALREPDLSIAQVSANSAAFTGAKPAELLGSPLGALLDAPSMRLVEAALGSAHPRDQSPLPLAIGQRAFDGILHRHRGATILEIEPTSAGEGSVLAPSVKAAMTHMAAAGSLQALFDVVARDVRGITGYDRVLLYRFNGDEHGEIVAEDKRDDLEPYLGLRYPASDIPKQARELYRVNQLRIIPDGLVEAVPIIPRDRPDTGEPLDLTFSVLRSVSPVHLEYMRNIGFQASMSVAVVHQGALWGLISCNHGTPRRAPHAIRVACEILAQLLAAKIAAREGLEAIESIGRRRGTLLQIIEGVRAEGSVQGGLVRRSPHLLDVVEAGGAAVYVAGSCATIGQTPSAEQIRLLVGWLQGTARSEVFATSALSRVYPPAESFQDVASGLLAFSLPKPDPELVLWFRPEVIQTVRWGGDPSRPVEAGEAGGMLHPRRSFALWKELVRGTSAPFSAADLETASALRRTITEVDLAHQVELERAARAEAREASRARDELIAVVSHDLASPLSAIIAGASGLAQAVVDTQKASDRILRSAKRMAVLLGDLRAIERIQVHRFAVEPRAEGAGSMVEEAVELIRSVAEEKHVAIHHAAIAPELRVNADRDRVLQVFSNLLGNAVRFTPSGGSVDVGVEALHAEVCFAIRDTGPGIAADQVTRVFERGWHAPPTEGGGTGLGLYICKGIVEAHGGRIWVESRPGAGSTFSFTLPVA